MILPRDYYDDNGYYYTAWGSWGKWVLLAVIIVIVIGVILSFFVRKRTHALQQAAAQSQGIPLGPVYPQNPHNPHGPQAMPPPQYQPDGNAYTGPVWHDPNMQSFGEKGIPQYPQDMYGNASYYHPPPNAAYQGGAGQSHDEDYGPPPGPPPRT